MVGLLKCSFLYLLNSHVLSKNVIIAFIHIYQFLFNRVSHSNPLDRGHQLILGHGILGGLFGVQHTTKR